jgi:hypothetical protein
MTESPGTDKPINNSSSSSSSSVETSVGAQERLRALIVEAFEAGSNNAIAREQDCGDYKIPTYDEEIARLTRELESLLMSAPLRGKDAEIDRGVLSTARLARHCDDLSHFDTRAIIGDLLSIIERQNYEMDTLGQILYDVERQASAPLQENMQEQEKNQVAPVSHSVSVSNEHPERERR